MEIYPTKRQRNRLLEFLKRIDGRPNALSRDDCGDWAIHGKYGLIYAVPRDKTAATEGFLLVFGAAPEHEVADRPQSVGPRRWGHVKAGMAFCSLTQDGDGEGSMALDRMPSDEEGRIIRSFFGIPKAVGLSIRDRAVRINRLAASL